LECRIQIVVAPVDSGTASWADRPAVQKALLSERRKMRSGYRAQRRTDLLPQVHQSAGKGGISMVICLPLDMACGLSSISRSGIQASEVVCPLRYCLGPIESFVGFYLLSYPQSYTLPGSSAAGTFELSSGLCRQSWILSKHSQLRMHRLRST
jgi:hypothetical protein